MDGSSHSIDSELEIDAALTRPARGRVFEYDAHKNHATYAWNDLKRAFARRKLVATMVKGDFAARYRGTALGAFWLTATAALTVLGLGLIYAQVFQTDFKTYLPYVAIGIMVWGLISSFMNDGVGTFVVASSVFKQIQIPYSVFPMRLTGRLLMTFFYRALVAVGILVFVGRTMPFWQAGAAILGVVIIAWVGFWTTLLFGILGARFKDFGQIMGAVMTFAFFVTPVFWESSRLGDFQFVATLNPLYHFLNVVRGSLLSAPDLGLSFLVAGGFAIAMPLAAFAMFAKFRHRLPYWC